MSLLPWRGVSPRELTRSRIALFLRREPQKQERFFVDTDQTDLFRVAKKGPPQFGGGSFVITLTGEVRCLDQVDLDEVGRP